MKIAEWASIDHIKNPLSASALGLVVSLDAIDYGCPLVGFTPQEWTMSKALLMPTNHWSRVIEYPWCLVKAELHPHYCCADVGGGNNPFQFALAHCVHRGHVHNIDTAHDKLVLADQLPVRSLFPNVLLVCQDAMTVFVKFDRIFCISVLEHTPDPIAFVRHLRDNMTKDGGRLLLTFDVCDEPCEDFPIGIEGAEAILKELGLEMPVDKNAFAHDAIKACGKQRRLRVMMVSLDKIVK